MTTIHTPQEYANIYKILQKHDNSKQIVEYIKDSVLPNIDKHSFLDIGAGEGKITQQITPFFEHSFAIEPNPNYVEILKQLNDVTISKKTFQEAMLTQNYNFILCSHVMYHVTEDQWEDFVLKAYENLTENGILMFVVPSDQGPHYNKCISYNPKYKCYKLLKRIADKHGIPYQATIDNAFYNTTNLDEMYQICRFSILEDSFTYKMYQKLIEQGIEQFNQDVLAYAKGKQVAKDQYSLLVHPAFVTLAKV